MIGYARVSTQDQDTALQQDALAVHGVRRVYVESGSGVGPRPQLQVALAALGQGDTLVVWKLDRVARSLADLLAIQSRLKNVGASIRSLTEPLDTSSPLGEFTFQILGAVAQLERSMIRERVMAGQAAARARGQRWGRRRALSLEDEAQVVSMYAAGSYTMVELADVWGVGLGTIKCAVYRVLRPDAPYLTRVRTST
ncbi:recombinase family protein [Verminephrobacter aporrectodeae subsp. tuberculatae]|nr:recombinase family protein [Verminephrobacter aporrectodeae subsp. tuberculatae]MCW5288289.1 recombinase family protein [Verminephrobacter aporrectodeae subsp. tuberculatae]